MNIHDFGFYPLKAQYRFLPSGYSFSHWDQNVVGAICRDDVDGDLLVQAFYHTPGISFRRQRIFSHV